MNSHNFSHFLSFLKCPNDGSDLQNTDDNFLYFSNFKYPIINQIPVLIKEPQNHLLAHYNDITNYIERSLVQIKNLNVYLKSNLPKTSLERIRSKIHHLDQHLQEIESLFNESIYNFYSNHYDQVKVVINDNESSKSNSFLMSYYTNVFRDWFWDTEENLFYTNFLKLNDKKSNNLILGSGPSRFSYDLALKSPDNHFIASDLNYLFLHIANKITKAPLELTYLPEHPVSLKKIGVKLKSQYLKPLKNLSFFNTDFKGNHFKKKSFNNIIAPWFIDILEIPLEDIIKKINYLLEEDGEFHYIGAYSFQEFGEDSFYSPEEIIEQFQTYGFKLGQSQILEVPYLKNPYNAQYRMEKILFATFKKIKHYDFHGFKVDYCNFPSWISNHNETIKVDPNLEMRKNIYHTYHQLYSKISGAVSINKLSKVFSQEQNISQTQAKGIITEHFKKIYKDLIKF